MLDAYETVESWMMARSKLNPGKLIPAMMRYVSEPHAKYDMQTAYHLFFSPDRVLYTSLHVGTKCLAYAKLLRACLEARVHSQTV
jgi:hypothetical protein